MSEPKPEIVKRMKKGKEVKALVGLPGQQKHSNLKSALSAVGKNMAEMHVASIRSLDQKGVKA